MKTIKERAEERFCTDCIFPQFQGKDVCLECSACDNYIKIAEDQQKIDRERVCKWICTNCECRENCDGNSPYTCPTIKSITKAMEGGE